MNLLLWNVVLGLVWCFATESFTVGNLAAGLVLGHFSLYLAHRQGEQQGYFRRFPRTVRFLLYFLWEVVKANLRVAQAVVGSTGRIRPAIVAVPLEAKTDLEITFLANLITLTPGTLSLDVSDDRKVLYVHGMFVDDPEAFRNEIKDGFERRLLEVMR